MNHLLRNLFLNPISIHKPDFHIYLFERGYNKNRTFEEAIFIIININGISQTSVVWNTIQ